MTIFPFEVSWNICPEQRVCIEKPKIIYLGEEKIDLKKKSKCIYIRVYSWVSPQSQQMDKRINLPICKHPGEASLPWIWEYRKFFSPGSNYVSPLEGDGLERKNGGQLTRWFLLKINQYRFNDDCHSSLALGHSRALFRQDSPQGTDAREDLLSLPCACIGRSGCKLSLGSSPVS